MSGPYVYAPASSSNALTQPSASGSNFYSQQPNASLSQSSKTQFPAGWQPPYSGAPPIPSNLNVPVQQWSNGYWSLNPAFAQSSTQHQQQQRQQVPWVANNAWQGFSGQQTASGSQQNRSQAAYAQAIAVAVAQQQQGGASRNPYKRIPKPPSAEYMATKLSDNPLGLTNMIPREEVYKNQDPALEPSTPWIWNPKHMPDDDDEGIITAEYRDSHGNRKQEYRGEVRSVRPHGADETPHSPTGQENILTDKKQQHHRNPRKERRESLSSGNEGTPSASSPAAIPYKDNQNKRGKQSLSRHSSAPVTSASAYAQQFQVQQAQDYSVSSPSSPKGTGSSHTRYHSEEPPPSRAVTVHGYDLHGKTTTHESYTTHLDLRPTFSSRVVRTPDHYRSHSVSGAPPAKSKSVPPGNPRFISTPNIVTDFAQKMSVGTQSGARVYHERKIAQPVARHSSMPAALSYNSNGPETLSVSQSEGSMTMNTVRTFSEEPASSTTPLSPLYVGPTPLISSRPLGRGSASLGAIPETAASTPSTSASTSASSSASSTPYHHSTNPSPRSHSSGVHSSYTNRTPPSGSSTSSLSSHSPYRSSHSSSGHGHISGADPSHHIQSAVRTTVGSYVSPPRRANPLPSPPREIRYPLISQDPAQRQRTPPPGTYSRKIRRGFWNRRGDHLTLDGHMVYAPPGRTYPDELKGYPEEKEAFMGPFGEIVAWREGRPELPESLPRRGMEPQRPYDTFISYTYQ